MPIPASIELESINFYQAITLGPVREDGRVGYTITPAWQKHDGPGVYVVLDGNEIVYIGSYRRGLMRRWLYTKKRHLYHFKERQVLERLKTGSELAVFERSEFSIKEELCCEHNVWVNSVGIEAHLIEKLQPSWNNHGKGAKVEN